MGAQGEGGCAQGEHDREGGEEGGHGEEGPRRRSKSFAKTSRTTRPSSRRSSGTRSRRSTKTRISWTCRSGTRRSGASELLAEAGFTLRKPSAHQVAPDV